MIRLAYETAERIGAIRQLEWGEVDLDSRYVVFRAESRKGGGRDIQRDISAELAAWLRELKACGATLVFPWTKSETLLWHEFNKLCVVAEVTSRGFHGFRRTSASYLAAAGGDASAHLGHSSPQMTQAHYLDPSIVRPKVSAVDLLPSLDTPLPRVDLDDIGPGQGAA
jgi:integrase